MARPIALLLTVLTGFSGLVYEVTWQKYLASLLGSHSEAVAAVLAIYLGGLAAGYASFGWITRQLTERAEAAGDAPRLLRLYGLVEGSIGVWALLFPLLFSVVQYLSTHLPSLGSGGSFAVDVVLTILLIAPPTVLMGGTIPVLTQALSERVEEATRVHAWIYAANTCGAFFGALCAAFVLIPVLGLDGVVRAMGVLNLLAGASFLLLERRAPKPEPSSRPVAPPATPERFAGYAAVVLLSGFAMMCIQTVLNRVGALALGASHFSFAMIVAVFVLCIALGSLAVSALQRIPATLIAASQWLLVLLVALLYFELENTPYYAHVIRSIFLSIPESFYPYQLAVFLALLACLMVPIGLSGALLPLVFHHLRNEMGELGHVAGRLYAWNTVGSLLGALLGGYALLFFVDLQHVFALALAMLIASAGLLTALVLRLPRFVPLVSLGVAVAICFALPDWDVARLTSGLFRQRQPLPDTFHGRSALFASQLRGSKLIFFDDDPTTTVTVTEAGARSIIVNGKPDGNLRYDYTTMSLAGLVSALLAENPSRAFVVGWGMGVTAGALAGLDDVDEVSVAEISPGVLEAAPFFDAGTDHASTNPKIHTVRSDAYRALLRSDARYGVIASEPSNPWVMGVELLYSEEFLRAASERLLPGGVYAQWFHVYESDDQTVETILRTYKAVFGDTAVWLARGPDLLLLGFKEPSPELDLDAMRERFHRRDFRTAFRRADVETWLQLLSHEILPLGVIRATPMPGPLHTVRHPILSDLAARSFFVGGSASLPRMPSPAAAAAASEHSLLRREIGWVDASEDVLDEIARHACRMGDPIRCGTVLGSWLATHPDSPRLAQALLELRSAPELTVRRHEGVDARLLQDATLQTLAGFYTGQSVGPENSASPLEDARWLTRLFASYYDHAFPFERKSLDRIWSRCGTRTGSPASCWTARQEFGELLDGAPSVGR